MDRAHRLGQTRQVTVYRLITKGTIDERIVQLARVKKDVSSVFLTQRPDTDASLRCKTSLSATRRSPTSPSQARSCSCFSMRTNWRASKPAVARLERRPGRSPPGRMLPSKICGTRKETSSSASPPQAKEARALAKRTTRTKVSPPHRHLAEGGDEDAGHEAVGRDEEEGQEVGAAERPTSRQGTTAHDRAITRTQNSHHSVASHVHLQVVYVCCSKPASLSLVILYCDLESRSRHCVLVLYAIL